MAEPTALPHDGQIEQALISCVLRKGKLFQKLDAIVKPSDFYHPPFTWAWKAFERITENGLAIDVLTFSDQLRRDEHGNDFTNYSNAFSGHSAISAIIADDYAELSSAESYAMRVKQFAGKRKLVLFCNDVAERSYNGKTPGEIIQYANQQLVKISVGNGVHLATVKDTREAAIDAMDSSERRSKTPDADFIKSGFIDLDAMLGGYENSSFYVFAGRPGMGKTIALITSALYNAEHHKRVFMWSGEMSTKQYTYRFIAQIAADLDSRGLAPKDKSRQIEVVKMKTGQMDADEWWAYYKAMEYYMTLPIFIDETAGLKVDDFRTLARIRAEMGLDIIYADHLGLFHADRARENRTQEVNYISRTLKEIAKELDKPVVSAVQLNRNVEKRASNAPILSDLNESGNIEQDADAVIFVHEPDGEEYAGMRCLKVAKNRDGPVGTAQVFVNGKIMRFDNAIRRTTKL